MASSASSAFPLSFDPTTLPRELNRHYIAASEDEIKDMLSKVGVSSMEGLYAHLPSEARFATTPALPVELDYEGLQERLAGLAREKQPQALLYRGWPQHFRVPAIVPFVSGLRNLATAYTPYQPERSQGTLATHWIYQCVMSHS